MTSGSARTILLLGGTGKVGTSAARALAAGGHRVRVLSRTPERARVPPGVEVVGGDLGDPESLERAFTGVGRAALIPPLDRDEERLDANALGAAAAAGVERLVLVSVAGLEWMPSAVHLDAKRFAEREAERLGLPTAVVRPHNFFQNDVAVWPLIEGGMYPVPIGSRGSSSVDTRDVGEAVAALLTGEDRSGTRVTLAGPEPFTGEAAAQLWSRVLGREVRYVAADLDGWAAMARQHRPGWLVESLVAMYRAVHEHGAVASAADVAAGEALRGRPARRYGDFAAELAAGDPVV